VLSILLYCRRVKPNMAVVELDPVFLKALKFLHSNSRETAYQLKQLLDDAISLRKGYKVCFIPEDIHVSDTIKELSAQQLKYTRIDLVEKTFNKVTRSSICLLKSLVYYRISW